MLKSARGKTFSINQSINQSIKQSIRPSINQSINQSNNQTIKQSINQSIGGRINQSIEHSTERSRNYIQLVLWGRQCYGVLLLLFIGIRLGNGRFILFPQKILPRRCTEMETHVGKNLLRFVFLQFDIPHESSMRCQIESFMSSNQRGYASKKHLLLPKSRRKGLLSASWCTNACNRQKYSRINNGSTE